MLLHGDDMGELQKKIDEEIDGLRGRINTISRINAQNVEEDKAEAYRIVLIEVVSEDDNFREAEIKYLIDLVKHMRGASNDSDDKKRVEDEKRIEELEKELWARLKFAGRGEEAQSNKETMLTKQHVYKLLMRHRVFDLILPPVNICPRANGEYTTYDKMMATKLQKAQRRKSDARKEEADKKQDAIKAAAAKVAADKAAAGWI